MVINMLDHRIKCLDGVSGYLRGYEPCPDSKDWAWIIERDDGMWSTGRGHDDAENRKCWHLSKHNEQRKCVNTHKVQNACEAAIRYRSFIQPEVIASDSKRPRGGLSNAEIQRFRDETKEVMAQHEQVVADMKRKKLATDGLISKQHPYGNPLKSMVVKDEVLAMTLQEELDALIRNCCEQIAATVMQYQHGGEPEGEPTEGKDAGLPDGHEPGSHYANGPNKVELAPNFRPTGAEPPKLYTPEGCGKSPENAGHDSDEPNYPGGPPAFRGMPIRGEGLVNRQGHDQRICTLSYSETDLKYPPYQPTLDKNRLAMDKAVMAVDNQLIATVEKVEQEKKKVREREIRTRQVELRAVDKMAAQINPRDVVPGWLNRIHIGIT
jgi:hypothetical protein